jgi:5-methyltetrahydrofolate--homocysteine methyltransferase
MYREDIDAVRDRLTHWWRGGDIGRPALLLTAPRDEPREDIPALSAPADWITDYSIRDYAYRVNLAARAPVNNHYLAEAVPTVAPDLAPNCLALYLGCDGVEGPGTVWCEPFLDDPEAAHLRFDASNRYWQFTLRFGRDLLRLAEGRCMVQFPDLIEGLDTLAAMRGNQRLLVDLIERPNWVRDALTDITRLYFRYYDPLYEMFRDERGGSHFWAWAPGRMCKLQCDFSAMISPAMFGEFMVPVLDEMTRKLDHCMYHWDGPGAIPHHDHLLALEHLDMLQWTPGSGVETTTDPRWWPLYHKTVEAGKKIYIGCEDAERLAALKREFGPKLKQFLIGIRAGSLAQADDIIRMVTD